MKHNHHELAAQHYFEAARNLQEAHENHQDGKDERASHFAYAALGHRLKGDEHAREASKQYAEAGPKIKSTI